MSAPSDSAETESAGATGRVFHGWWLAALFFLTQLIAIGIAGSMFQVLVIPLSETLQVGRAQLAVAPALQLVLFGLVGAWLGGQVNRHSARALLLAGFGALALGLLVLAAVQSTWQLYLAYGVFMSVGMSAIMLTSNAVLGNWFSRMRGRAVGIANFGTSISGAFFVPAVSLLTAVLGFRVALLCLLAPLAVLVPLVWWLVSSRPEDRGLHPDGDARPAPDTDTHEAIDWTMGRALRDRRLRKMFLGFAFLSPGLMFAVSYLYPHLIDGGLSAQRAALVVSVMMFSAACAKLLFGAAADYLSSRGLLVASAGLQVIGVGLLTSQSGLAVTLLGCSTFGLGYGGVMPLQIVSLSLVVGREALPRLMGYTAALAMPTGIFAGIAGNIVWDQIGSYQPVFPFLMASFVVSALLFASIRFPHPRAAKRLAV